MPKTSAGRPRLRSKRRPGLSPRDEILDAAAELFTTRGYASTSTRSIADAVGVRQASLYHYFKTKDDILCALLRQTVTPTLDFVAELARTAPELSAVHQLHVLATFDGAQLLHGRWNLGALYLLPELRQVGLVPFWAERERLRLHYLALGSAIAAPGLGAAAPDLPFRLVESLVNIRAAQLDDPAPDLPDQVADACLRVLGVDETQIALAADRTRTVLAGVCGHPDIALRAHR